MKVLSAPQKISLNITNRCNLSCLYCAVSPTKNAPGDMNLDEWKSIIDELARIKVFSLLISGGEPFTRSDFLDILKHISQYHFRYSINTNGTLFDEKILSFLSESRRLDNIQVSMDGPNRHIHDAIRGQGSFEKTTSGINRLRKNNIPYTFFVVVCKNNKDHLKEIVQFSKKISATKITFSPLLPQGSALEHLDDLSLNFQEYKKVEVELRKLKKADPNLVGGTLVQTIELMDKMSEIDISKQPPGKGNNITSCGGSVVECSIRPEGWVVPCDRLWDYKVGNVKDEPFQTIWKDSEGFRVFRKRYARRIDSFVECRNCDYTAICKGGCPAIPYYMGKGIEGWDPFSCYKVFTGEMSSYV